jgi:uncharacterized protein
VIAVDTNVLLHAHRAESPLHERAATAVAALAEGREAWAIPWPCVHEFLAIVTHPRIYDPPTPLSQAIDQVAAWLESPVLRLLAEASDHWARLQEVLQQAGVVGARVHDARVAALCHSHGVRELWTLDRDFSRFPDVRTVNPLSAGRTRPGSTG